MSKFETMQLFWLLSPSHRPFPPYIRMARLGGAESAGVCHVSHTLQPDLHLHGHQERDRTCLLLLFGKTLNYYSYYIPTYILEKEYLSVISTWWGGIPIAQLVRATLVSKSMRHRYGEAEVLDLKRISNFYILSQF